MPPAMMKVKRPVHLSFEPTLVAVCLFSAAGNEVMVVIGRWTTKALDVTLVLIARTHVHPKR